MVTENELKLVAAAVDNDSVALSEIELKNVDIELLRVLSFPITLSLLRKEKYKKLLKLVERLQFSEGMFHSVIGAEADRLARQDRYKGSKAHAELLYLKLLEAADELGLRSLIVPFNTKLYFETRRLGKEEALAYASSELYRGQKSIAYEFLHVYGFDLKLASELLREDEYALNYDFISLLPLEELASVIRDEDSAKTFLTKVINHAKHYVPEVLKTLDFVSPAIVKLALSNVYTTAGFRERLEALQENPRAVEFIAPLLAVEGEPSEGRPNAEQVERLKTARRDHRNGRVNRFQMDDLEAAALAYTLVLASKENSLKRAKAAEDSGTASDPFRVTEIEAELANVKRYIKTQAQREVLEKL